MYHIPGWVLYKGRKVEIFTRGVEHGPVFEAGLHELCETAIKLLESFQATLDPALRLKNISTIHTGAYVKMCRCEDCKNCMLQHYPDQIEQMVRVLRQKPRVVPATRRDRRDRGAGAIV
jgi:hypothetical protein